MRAPGDTAGPRTFAFPWPVILPAALAAAALLPFAWRAFKIDDPLFIWCARQIARHPFDPYGFQVNWFGSEMPMWEVMRNPPLASYYLALFGGLFGWSEPVLHAAMIVAAAACVAGTAALARHFTTSAALAGLLLLATPVFFVSATTVMCDVLMLALVTWSAAAWVSGIDRGRTGRLAASGVLLAAAALTKFSALLVLPAFILYARAHAGWKPLAALALPVTAVAAYLAAARALYGGSLFDALALASTGGVASGAPTRGAVLLTFLGGCCISVLCAAPLLWPWRRVLAGCSIAALLTGLALWTGWLRGVALLHLSLAGPSALIQAALFGISGVVTIIFTFSVWRRTERAAWLLVPWIAAVLIFAAFGTWTMSGRYLLPLAPPLAVGAALMIDRRRPAARPMARALTVLLSAAVSLTVAGADAALADSARTAAERICLRFGRTVWFQGHWGFQYYMEQQGARPLDSGRSLVRPGEIIVVPDNNANTFPLEPGLIRHEETLEFEYFSRFSTMNAEAGAGFYASVWGPFPYAAGVISPEKYYILSVVSP